MLLFPAVPHSTPPSSFPLRSTKRLLPALGLALLATLAQAQGFQQCKAIFPTAQPPRVAVPAGATRELCYDAFATLYSGRSKTPLYTVEKLTREQLLDAKDEERTNRFFPDARLPSAERATLEDYKGSGYDRGHMAAAANMPTAQAMAQSFSLANVVPQARINNQRTWAEIEKSTRRYVMRAAGPVYVFTGPVFPRQRQPRTIGDGVWVPSYLYKLVYDASTRRAWAYWVENSNEAKVAPPITYKELVDRTGIEFLPGVLPGP